MNKDVVTAKPKRCLHIEVITEYKIKKPWTYSYCPVTYLKHLGGNEEDVKEMSEMLLQLHGADATKCDTCICRYCSDNVLTADSVGFDSVKNNFADESKKCDLPSSENSKTQIKDGLLKRGNDCKDLEKFKCLMEDNLIRKWFQSSIDPDSTHGGTFQSRNDDKENEDTGESIHTDTRTYCHTKSALSELNGDRNTSNNVLDEIVVASGACSVGASNLTDPKTPCDKSNSETPLNSKRKRKIFRSRSDTQEEPEKSKTKLGSSLYDFDDADFF